MATGLVEEGIADSIQRSLLQKGYHYQLYVEVGNRDLTAILNFNKNGLEIVTEQRFIRSELKKYEDPGRLLVDVPLPEDSKWKDVLEAIDSIKTKNYRTLGWNCQSFCLYIMERIMKRQREHH